MDPDLRALISLHSKHKARSHETHHSKHIPFITPSNFEIVLIGDSMIERFETTGATTRIAKLPSSLNVGVGGDKIENVLYRLDIGLLDVLQDRNTKIWLLAIGTNNLGKKGLKDGDLERYRVLLRALLGIAEGSKVLACEVFRREDIADKVVAESNRLLRQVVANVNVEVGGEKVVWSDAPAEITGNVRVDHVHLNEEGYGIWSEVLHKRLDILLNGEREEQLPIEE